MIYLSMLSKLKYYGLNIASHLFIGLMLLLGAVTIFTVIVAVVLAAAAAKLIVWGYSILRRRDRDGLDFVEGHETAIPGSYVVVREWRY